VYAAAKFMGAAEEFMGDHRDSWELSFWSRSRTACIVNVVTTPKRAGQLGQDVALCVWCIYGAYFVRLQEQVLLDVLCVIFIDFR